ncbi:MAG: hypothetical protein RR295_08605 [Oscillospiraceae bacterium]
MAGDEKATFRPGTDLSTATKRIGEKLIDAGFSQIEGFQYDKLALIGVVQNGKVTPLHNVLWPIEEERSDVHTTEGYTFTTEAETKAAGMKFEAAVRKLLTESTILVFDPAQKDDHYTAVTFSKEGKVIPTAFDKADVQPKKPGFLESIRDGWNQGVQAGRMLHDSSRSFSDRIKEYFRTMADTFRKKPPENPLSREKLLRAGARGLAADMYESRVAAKRIEPLSFGDRMRVLLGRSNSRIEAYQKEMAQLKMMENGIIEDGHAAVEKAQQAKQAEQAEPVKDEPEKTAPAQEKVKEAPEKDQLEANGKENPDVAIDPPAVPEQERVHEDIPQGGVVQGSKAQERVNIRTEEKLQEEVEAAVKDAKETGNINKMPTGKEHDVDTMLDGLVDQIRQIGQDSINATKSTKMQDAFREFKVDALQDDMDRVFGKLRDPDNTKENARIAVVDGKTVDVDKMENALETGQLKPISKTSEMQKTKPVEKTPEKEMQKEQSPQIG